MTTANQVKYIEFGIGGENYAVKIEEVDEIIKLQPITDIPFARRHVKGVINLRSHIIPVVTLRGMLGLPEEAHTKSTRIVIVKHEGESIGMIVDRVNQVTTYSNIQPPPEQIGRVSGEVCNGIGMRNEQLVSILNTEELFIRGPRDRA
ncbi:MAG: cheW-2 2 [Paenibacillus sp.]|jgi:purine-binding chemotaxis protein CheW|nr:cheW-2 2 [Paenibacillus sp.]